MMFPLLEFTVTNFSKLKEFSSTYISPSFLTHSRDYKLRLEVEANKKSYVSVYTRLLKGDSDDHLVWPIEVDILVQLLNWRQDAYHHNYTIHCNGRASALFTCISCIVYELVSCDSQCRVIYICIL